MDAAIYVLPFNGGHHDPKQQASITGNKATYFCLLRQQGGAGRPCASLLETADNESADKATNGAIFRTYQVGNAVLAV